MWGNRHGLVGKIVVRDHILSSERHTFLACSIQGLKACVGSPTYVYAFVDIFLVAFVAVISVIVGVGIAVVAGLGA